MSSFRNVCDCHWEQQEGSVAPIKDSQGFQFKFYLRTFLPVNIHMNVESCLPSLAFYFTSGVWNAQRSRPLTWLCLTRSLKAILVVRKHFSQPLCLQCHGTFTWQRPREWEVLSQSSVTSPRLQPWSAFTLHFIHMHLNWFIYLTIILL